MTGRGVEEGLEEEGEVGVGCGGVEVEAMAWREGKEIFKGGYLFLALISARCEMLWADGLE